MSQACDIAERQDPDANSELHNCLQSLDGDELAEAVWKLLQKGTSVYGQNKLGLTPVHIAAANGHAAALKIILTLEPQAVDVLSAGKETPLFWAVQGGYEDCVKALLFWGAGKDIVNARGQRPYDVAPTTSIRALLSDPNGSGLTEDSLYDDVPEPLRERLQEASNHGAMFQVIKSRRSTSLDNDQLRRCTSGNAVSGKTELCRYYRTAGGCTRGANCMFAHGEKELRASIVSRSKKKSSFQDQTGFEDLGRKVFIGGLAPSVQSEELRDFFQQKYGAITDAVVISSQSGSTLQSRGFGFVTFKTHQSAEAAVRDHYVVLQGKKVEIKSAIPRPLMVSAECCSPDDAGAALAFKKALEMSCYQSRGIKLPHESAQMQSGPDDSAQSGQIGSGPGAQDSAQEELQPTFHGPPPPWFSKFKEWLPRFLDEVHKRLKDGEHYPLSSLKGDFRATCGFEMDHASIGFPKLSDFVRLMKDVVQMRVTPVGTGPATHMILLPAEKKQEAAPQSKPVSYSVVSPGRSYAAAATALRPQEARHATQSDADTSQFPSSVFPDSALDGAGDGKDSSAALHRDCLFLDEQPGSRNAFLSSCGDGCLDVWEELNVLGSTDAEPIDCCDKFLHRRIASLTLPDARRDDLSPSGACSWGATGSLHSFQQSAWAGEIRDAPTFGTGLQPPSRPLLQDAWPIFSPSRPIDHHLFLSHNLADTARTTILQPAAGSLLLAGLPQSFAQTCGGDQGYASCHFEGVSKPSVVPADKSVAFEAVDEPVTISEGQLHFNTGERKVSGLYHSSAPTKPISEEGSGQDGEAFLLHRTTDCLLCSERRALWQALPCNHQTLCAVCKEKLQTLSFGQHLVCLLCHSHVERWVAR